VDNPASFHTALKSGFRLFEKRVPYDYFYSHADPNDFDEVGNYLTEKQSETGSCYYYFRKYNPISEMNLRFYGDAPYDGRFA
jgi:hypothetical protein